MLLHGYNHLTKSLALSIYTLDYVDSLELKQCYVKDINNQFCADVLADMLTTIATDIGGQVLNRAIRNYQPQGASATLMIAEAESGGTPMQIPCAVVDHLDKSHLCIHTYPEEHFIDHIAIFRADIDISSCGLISPLLTLNKIIEQFAPDIVNIDYRVRGYDRRRDKKNQFIDHEINSIQDYLSPKILQQYQARDNNLTDINFFHSSLLNTQTKQQRAYRLNDTPMNAVQKAKINKLLHKEANTLFKGNA